MRKYQLGTIERKSRKKGPDVWAYRYTDHKTGKRAYKVLGTVLQYKTESQAQKGAEQFRIEANSEKPKSEQIPFSAVIREYKNRDLSDNQSTRSASLPWIKNYIEPKWGSYPVDKIGRPPIEIEDWIESLKLAPKSKYHIKSAMRGIYETAIRLGLVEITENPLKHVKLKDGQKRLSDPIILTPYQCWQIAQNMEPKYRPMVIVAMCLGLRVSEILGLKWSDFDFDSGYVYIQRAIVIGTVKDTKTIKSKKVLPISELLKDELSGYRKTLAFDSDWVFVNPDRDKPWEPGHIRKKIASAGKKLGIIGVGWHTFRHTYSSTLRKNGVDIKVQQDLMRHATPQITLQTYTQLPSEDLRQANEQVTRMMLQPTSGTVQ